MITKEQLLQNGWKETDDDIFSFEKQIENRNPINRDPEDTGINLVAHRMYNIAGKFALALPDGGLLNLNINNIEDLNKFENMIDFYDCPY